MRLVVEKSRNRFNICSLFRFQIKGLRKFFVDINADL